MTVTHLYLAGVSVLCVGVLWFYIVRPMLEGFGLIAPQVSSDLPAAPAEIMSNEARNDAPSLASDHRPDARPRDETPARPKATDEQFLTLFEVFKAAGYSREEARSILRPFGVPVDNNLYSRAPKPPEPMGGDPRIKVPPYQRPPQTADELA